MVKNTKGQFQMWSLVMDEIPKKMNTIISITWASILIMYFSVSRELYKHVFAYLNEIRMKYVSSVQWLCLAGDMFAWT